MKVLSFFMISLFVANTLHASLGVGALNAFAQIASGLSSSTYADPARPDSGSGYTDYGSANTLNSRPIEPSAGLSTNTTDWDRYYKNQDDFFSTYIDYRKEMGRLEDKRSKNELIFTGLTFAFGVGAKICEVYGENKRREEFVMAEIERLNWELENNGL